MGQLRIAQAGGTQGRAERISAAPIVTPAVVPLGRHAASTCRTNRDTSQRKTQYAALDPWIAVFVSDDRLNLFEQLFGNQPGVLARDVKAAPLNAVCVERITAVDCVATSAVSLLGISTMNTRLVVLTACVIGAIFGPTADAQTKIVTRCTGIEGHAFYVKGGLVKGDSAGWQKHSIGNGEFLVTKIGKDYDIIFVDAANRTVSTREDGQVYRSEEPAGHVDSPAVYDGNVEMWTFRINDAGRGFMLVSLNRFDSPLGIEKYSLMRANCSKWGHMFMTRMQRLGVLVLCRLGGRIRTVTQRQAVASPSEPRCGWTVVRCARRGRRLREARCSGGRYFAGRSSRGEGVLVLTERNAGQGRVPFLDRRKRLNAAVIRCWSFADHRRAAGSIQRARLTITQSAMRPLIGTRGSMRILDTRTAPQVE